MDEAEMVGEYERWDAVIDEAIKAREDAYNAWDKKGPPPSGYGEEAAKAVMRKHGALTVQLPDSRAFQLLRAAISGWWTGEQKSEILIPPYQEENARRALLGHGYAEIDYLVYAPFEVKLKETK